jgi:hypothetical protein
VSDGEAVRLADRFDLLDDAQACRAGASVAGDLVGGGALGDAANDPHRLHGTADTGQFRGAVAGTERLDESLLDDPVLTGVVGEDRDAASCDRRRDGLVDRLGERVEFAVDLDPDRLEGPLRRVPARTARGRGDRRRSMCSAASFVAGKR